MSRNFKQLSSSFRDPSGFIFVQDKILYRQINKIYKENYDLLFSSGLYHKLVDAEFLIPHTEVEFSPPQPELSYKIIKPERVSFISYPYEWSFSQLKKAALTTLRIQKLAIEHGLSLKDASAYNIQFHNGKCLMLDTLSFEKLIEGQPWVAYKQFCQHFLAPLALMSHTDIRLNILMRNYIDGIPLDLCVKLLPKKTKFNFSLLTHLHLHAKSQSHYADKQVAPTNKKQISKQALLGIIDSLETAINKLKWKQAKTEWGDYYNDTNYSEQGLENKKSIIESYIDKIQPKVVWDLGANLGLFSRIASDKQILSIAFDIDPVAVEKNYLHSLKNKERSIIPLLQDLTNPSPSIGWNNQERDSLLKRGPVDTVMALALIHHLAISNNLPFENISEFFASLIANYLIIEFVPKKDSQVQRLLASREDIFDKYTETDFEKAFTQFFEISQKRDNSRDKPDVIPFQEKISMKKFPILHTFLFALLPIFFLYSHNTSLINISEIIRPFSILMFTTILLLILFRFLYGNLLKASTALSVLLIFFFAYGHLHAMLPDFRWHIGSIVLYPNTVVLPIWALLLFTILVYIRLSKQSFHKTVTILNVVSVLLILSTCVTALSSKLLTPSTHPAISLDTKSIDQIDNLPDIYYIILDGYAGNEILHSRFQYDNNSFTEALSKKGFTIVENAQSNYCQTLLSISSSLNFQYHDSLATKLGKDSEDRKTLINKIKQNKIMVQFQQFGYTTIALSSGYYGTEISNADKYLTTKGSLSEFEEILLHTTPIPVVLRKMKSSQLHVERIKRNFEYLTFDFDITSPKFVFAHFICPHPPFLFNDKGKIENKSSTQVFTFGKNGIWPDGKENEQKYINQIQFVNKEMLRITDLLLSDSSSDKIIIIQSDHGSLFPRDEDDDSLFYKEKFSILHALYLPDINQTEFPNDLTPVNTFRFILNKYFNQEYQLLPNRSLYSIWQKPYNFMELPPGD